ERYLQGAFYGLLWTAQNPEMSAVEKVYAAYNILGVTMHAFEDFYSHSTWVNHVDRRSKNVFRFKRSEILGMGPELFTSVVNDDSREFSAGYNSGSHSFHGGSGTSDV